MRGGLSAINAYQPFLPLFFTENAGNVLRMDISQKNILIMQCKITTFWSFPQSLYLGILVSNSALLAVNPAISICLFPRLSH